MALILLGGAAAFLVRVEGQLRDGERAITAFASEVDAALRTLGDLRAAQQAYVAAGQGPELWGRKAEALLRQAVATVDALRTTASDTAAGVALIDAAARLTELAGLDRRARDYVRAGQPLMASDVVFTDGSSTIAEVIGFVEDARSAAQQASRVETAARRRQQGAVVAGALALAGLTAALLVFVPRRGRAAPVDATSGPAAGAPVDAQPHETADPARAATSPTANAVREHAQAAAFKAAAELCTDLGCAHDAQELTRLLARAASTMDASGVIVWLGSADGADLAPVLAHGYSAQVLARMPRVPRSADNAAATAYRKATLQIVLARPGRSAGAIVAPLLSPQGCIGALAAEFVSGSETSDTAQALATILAAQLVGLLAPAGALDSSAAHPEPRSVSA